MVITFRESYSAAKEWCAIRGREEQSKPNTVANAAPNLMADMLSRPASAVKSCQGLLSPLTRTHAEFWPISLSPAAFYTLLALAQDALTGRDGPAPPVRARRHRRLPGVG